MKRAAFTLAEVIVSTFVMGLVVMTIFALFPTSAMAVKRGENRLAAENLALAGLEECRAQPFANLVLGTTTLPPVSLGTTAFQRTRTIFAVPGSPDTRFLKGVKVTVSWVEQSKAQQTVAQAWLSHVER